MKPGVDIVEVQRIHELIERHGVRFLDKVFTKKEQNYCEKGAHIDQRYAGRFAAKEAIRKALQPFTNEVYLPFTQIEILPDDFGVPVPVLLKPISTTTPYQEISVSISHENDYAIAMAIIE